MPFQLFEASNYSLNIFSAPTAIAAASIFLLGLLVVARERLTPISAAFFLVTITVTIWLICSSWVYSANNEAAARWWAKAAYIGIPFIAPATYLFTLLLLGSYQRHHALRFVVWASWLLAFLFASIAIATDALVSGMTLYAWGYYTAFGGFGIPFIIFFAALLIGSMAHYSAHYRKAPPGKQRQRIRSLMLAFGIGYGGIVDFVPTYGIPLYPFGYLFIFGFVLLAARAIWAYHLPAITPAFAAKQIIDTMGEALLVLDTSGVVRVANKAACDLFESSQDDLIGQPLSTAIAGATFGQQAWRTMQAIVWQGELRDHEMSYLSKEGNRRALSVSATVARMPDNDPVGVVCIVRDITRHKQAEADIKNLNQNLELLVARRTAELQAANQELQSEIAERQRAEDERAQLLISEQRARLQAEEAAHARQLFLSIVSHDLRNPLAAMRGSAGLIHTIISKDKTELDSRVEVGLARIENSAKKMSRLIDELLDLARLQAGQPLDLYRQDIDVVELARTVIETHQEYADRHTIILEAGIPTLHGTWDPLRLERALDNLVSNAIKYSPRGGRITIEISAEQPDVEGLRATSHGRTASPRPPTPDTNAVIIVRDEGMGIPAEDLPHIFDWFHRATNVSGRISGTGIGLATVRQTVEQHGGSITVKSVEGKGTTFTLRLPLSPPTTPDH